MRLIAGAAALAALALAASANVRAQFGAGGATVRCPGGFYEIAFDPRSRVVVRNGDREVAAATFAWRRVSRSCARATRMEGRDDALRRRGIYHGVRLECTLRSRVSVHVHPIIDGTDRVIGSVVSLTREPSRLTAVSAVLKNRGDPAASRVYYAPRWCKTAP